MEFVKFVNIFCGQNFAPYGTYATYDHVMFMIVWVQ